MGFFGSLLKKNEVSNTHDVMRNLSNRMISFTSNAEEKLALAKELLCHAKLILNMNIIIQKE